MCIGSLNSIALYIRDRASLNVAICKELVPRPFEDMTLCLMSKALPHGPGIFMGWETFISVAKRFLSLPQALTEKNICMELF